MMKKGKRSLSGKKVLVTGAGGFIGSHLVEALVREGANVTAMIHYNALSSWGNLDLTPGEIKKEIQVQAGTIEDSDFVMQIADGMDAIFHLAALIAIPYSYVAPRTYVRTNVEGTLNILEAARRKNVGMVLHTSTSEVYGTAITEPINESHPLQGQSPYSASKIGADKIAESYWRSFGTNVVTIRPFNTYGPRQSARAFIPTIISQAATREEVKLGSLHPMRDMTYVTDTVAGYIAAASSEGIGGRTFNLGTGNTYSIGDFASRILSLMNSNKKVVQDADRMRPENSEVGKLVSDNSLAREFLGWQPVVDLDTGLSRTIEFVLAHRHLFRTDIYSV